LSIDPFFDDRGDNTGKTSFSKVWIRVWPWISISPTMSGGNRLCELEKKITNVYQEFVAAETIDDNALFANEDDEEEESAFLMHAPSHGLNTIGRNAHLRYVQRRWQLLQFGSESARMSQFGGVTL
jgi:hypothetical protein